MKLTMTYKEAAQRGHGLHRAGFDFRQIWVCEGCRARSRVTNWVTLAGECQACGHNTDLGPGGSGIEVIDDPQSAGSIDRKAVAPSAD